MIGRAFFIFFTAIAISVSVFAETEMPPEMQKLEYFRQVDQKADIYARRLSYAYVYLQKINFNWYKAALFPGIRLRFAKDLYADPQLRESLTEWSKVFALGFVADFDSMSESDLVLLSKPKFVQALQVSAQFWKTLSVISRGLNHDIRPAIDQDLKRVSLAGNGLFFAASTISIGWMLKAAFGLRAIRFIIPGLRARRAAGLTLFSTILLTRDHAAAQENPTVSTAVEIATQSTEATNREIAIHNENLRRQFILNEAIKVARKLNIDLDQNLGKVSLSASGVNTYACDNEKDIQSLIEIKSGFLEYQKRFLEDRLAIKRGDDNILIRENVGQALQFLLNVIEVQESNASLREAC